MAKQSSNFVFDPIGQRKPRKSHGAALMILFMVVVVLATVLMINHAGNSQIQLQTEYVRVMALDSNFEGLRILHISDLQGSVLGSDGQKWISLLSGAKWDAVVMSGDMIGADGNNEPMLSLIHILKNLRPEAPIYFIAGDGDPDPVLLDSQESTNGLAPWVEEAVAAGAVYLDAPCSMNYGSKKVWFSPAYLYDLDVETSAESMRTQLKKMEAQGIQYDLSGSASYRALLYRLDTMDRTLAAQKEMSAEDVQIAVNHMPLETEYIRSATSEADPSQIFNFRAVDLVLSGHYCGGTYRLPFSGGAIWVADKGFFPSDDGILGMFRINSTNLYISPGLSAASDAPVKLRLFNRPAVTILRFTGTIE